MTKKRSGIPRKGLQFADSSKCTHVTIIFLAYVLVSEIFLLSFLEAHFFSAEEISLLFRRSVSRRYELP